MQKIADNLYVGNQQDYENTFFDDSFSFLLAAKEPWHREMIGYKGRACDKSHPEYLWGYRDRGSKLILNMVDANSSLFFDKNMINEALDFIEEELFKGKNVLICCNKGESRSASLGLLFLIKQGHIKGETLTDCEAEYLKIYPQYNPGNGIREFVKMNFEEYSRDICPNCGNKGLDYDFVEEDDGSKHDIIDCPKCGKRLFYED